MLGFFRRFINSRTGVIVTFIVLGLIALAFAAGDVTGLRHSAGSGLTAKSVATVGGEGIGEAEVRSRAKDELSGLQQRNPGADMVAFVQQGGVEQTVDRLVSALALEQFAKSQGMVVSKKLIDGQIASIPALAGPDGKFSEDVFRRILQQQRMTEAQVRGDMTREAYAQALLAPTVGATQIPASVALPYASLLLEKRAGTIGSIPAAALGNGAAPTDAELQTFYQRNIARYTVPERRVARYAIVTLDSLKAQAVPTDAEIAASYKAQGPRFAATQKRDLQQVNVLDQNAANALAAKVKGGTPIDAAAKTAGLEVQSLSALDKTAYANQSSPAAADAVFGATANTVVGPVKTAIGYAVVRVAKVNNVPAKSLEQARPELLAELGKQKLQSVLADVHDKLDNGTTDGSTFDELVADQKLTALTTPALLANGTDPLNAAAKPDAALVPILQAAFQAEEGDSPQLVQTAADGSFALVSLRQVIRAAPRPLAQVKDSVARDFVVDRQQKAARVIATQVIAKINRGTPIAQALAETKLSLPATRPMSAARIQLAQNPQGTPPPLALLFSMAEKRAKMLESADRSGWAIVYLDHIDKGDARGNPQALNAARGDIGRSFGRELAQQFTQAVKNEVGVTRSPTAIARVRAELSGQTPADAQ